MGELPDKIEDYLAYLDTVRRVSAQTLRAYRNDLSHFANYCAERGVAPESAESEDVRRFITALSGDEHTASSVNRALSSTRGFFRFLIRFKFRADDPSVAVRNLKQHKPLPSFLWENEMAEFAELPAKSGSLWTERDTTLILCMYSAGLRIGETVALSLEHFALDAGVARVIGKGGKEREVFFSDEARSALSAYLPLRTEKLRQTGKSTDAMFISLRGNPLSIDGVRWIINRYSQLFAVETGLGKNIHPHSLRHTFATHLVNAGCDVRVVQELLGHESISTTARYTHVNVEHLKEVYSHAHPHA